MEAARPGIRLSRMSVVLPEPETPVTTESLPFGKRTVRGFTVWIAPVSMRIWPRKKSCSGATRGRSTSR